MRRSLKEWILRVILLLIGLCVAHLGVTLFLLSDLGSDPFNVLVQGLYRKLEAATGLPFLTHGRVHVAVSLLIVAVLLLTDRSYIKIGTALCMLFGGPIIDFFSMLLEPLFAELHALPPRIAVLVLGCVILACGMTLVIRSDAGTGPNDLVALVISEKSGKSFSLVRVLVDASFALAGWLMGGVVGLGTLICMFLVGPVAGLFLPLSGRLVERVLRRFCPEEDRRAA